MRLAIVPLDRALLSSYMLPVVNVLQSVAALLQFLMHIKTGGSKPPNLFFLLLFSTCFLGLLPSGMSFHYMPEFA